MLANISSIVFITSIFSLAVNAAVATPKILDATANNVQVATGQSVPQPARKNSVAALAPGVKPDIKFAPFNVANLIPNAVNKSVVLPVVVLNAVPKGKERFAKVVKRTEQ